MRPNVIDFLAVQAFSGPVQTDCGRSAPKVGVKVAIAAATGAYRLSSENVLLPRAASDHGEELWEHGSFEHGHTLYQEVLRIPLIVKLPHSTSKERIGTPVATASIMPTVLDLCEIDYSAESLSVASLSESWGPELSSFHGQPVFSGNLLYYEDRESVIFEGLKYIRFLVTENREELYDLVLDPGESTSLVAELPREAERARALLDAEVATAKKLRQFHDLRPQKGSELDPETIRRLKSLGYIP